jgi:hypothetical protein
VRIRVAVLRCAEAGADVRGGLRWMEPMMEVACACMCGPHIEHSAGGDAPLSDSMSCISLF